MKKRVLIVPDCFPWILGTWAKEILKWNGNRYEFYFMSSRSAIGNPKRFRSLVEHVDLVHILSPHCLSYLSDHLDRSKTLSSVHHVAEWKTDFDIAADCREIMVVSEEWRDYLVARGVPPAKIILIYNGFDPDAYYLLPEVERAQARRGFGIEEGDFAIGTFSKRSSNQNDRKGIDTLLSSLLHFKKIAPKVPLKLLVTGPGWDDLPERHRELSADVIYRPFLPAEEMRDAYNALDLYLVTSRIEGGPAPLIEAMACMVPVVTTPVGMARDIIVDRENGLIVPKDDPAATASAILDLYQDTDLRTRIASAGRSCVCANFTWEKTAGNISTLYEPALDSGLAANLKRLYRRATQRSEYDPEVQRQEAIQEDYRRWAEELNRTL